MKIRRKIKKRNYKGGGSIPKYQSGGDTCPEGMVWDAMTGQCKPAPNMVFDGMTGEYKLSPQVANARNNTLQQIESDAELMELDSDIEELDAFTAQLEAQNKADEAQESKTFEDMIASEINSGFNQDMELDTTFGDPIQNPQQEGFFNPYAGVDIPTAANIFGQSIGPGGDAKTAVASGAKLVLGLGRNITSGIGRAKRNAEGLKEFNEKRRESMIGPSTALGEYGGTIKADLEALFDKVQFPVMREGGDVDDDIDIDVMTGSIATGTNTGDENVELEDGEFLQEPGSTPVKVEGKKHDEGGEKMNLPGGTEVLSDSLKLTKAQVKQISDEYSLKVSTKDTYAKALEKYNKSIGLTSIIEEEEEVIKEVKKQKQKAAEEGADEATINVNLEFLSSKLNDLTEQKRALEENSANVFNSIFKMQEDSKPDNKKDIQTEFNIGGRIFSQDQIMEIAKSYGVKEDKALQIIKSMEDGGSTDPKKGTFVRKKVAEEKVKNGEWEKIGDNQYVKRGEEGSERVVFTAGDDGQVLKSYKQVWDNGEVDKNLYPTFDKFVEAAEQYWEDNPEKRNSNGTEGNKEVIKTPGTPDEFFFSEDLKPVETIKAGLVMPEFEIKGEIDNINVDSFVKAFSDRQNEELDNSNTTNNNLVDDRENSGFDALLLPENMPLPPAGLQMPLKVNRRYGRLNRTALSPDARLAELERGANAAEAQLQNLPSGQKEAAILQLQANKQAQADRIIAETEQRENDINLNIDMFNTRQADRQEDADAIDALDYERRVFGALSNTEDDYRRFFNTVQERNIQNFNTINSINLLNQASENFDFGNEGVQFTGGSANFTPEGIMNSQRYRQAIATSNSGRSSLSKKATGKYGGKVKRRVKRKK